MSKQRDNGPARPGADNERSGHSEADAASLEEPAGAGLVPQLLIMARALLGSSVRNVLFVIWGLLVVVIGATAYGQIRLNRWNQPFYDALAHHQFREFLVQLGVFGVITG